MKIVMAILAAAVLFALPSTAQARHHRHHRHHHHHRIAAAGHVQAHTYKSKRGARLDGSGNIACVNGTTMITTAFGIPVCVDPLSADKFAALFSSLKARGCEVHEIVCQAYGHVSGSNHIGGGACDIDQRSRNRTSSCMYHAGDLIRDAGLFDGCAFRDCGHVEAQRGLGHYGERHHRYAHRRHIHWARR